MSFRELVQEAARPLIEGEDAKATITALVRQGIASVPGKAWISPGALGSLFVNWAGVPPETTGLALDNSPTRLMLAIHGLTTQAGDAKTLEVEVVRKNGLRAVGGLNARRGGTPEQVAAYCVRLVTRAATAYGSN